MSGNYQKLSDSNRGGKSINEPESDSSSSKIAILISKLKEAKFDWRLILLCFGLLSFNVGNNVSAAMIGYVMPGYQLWLLYMTTAVYACGFGIIAWRRGENVFRKEELVWSHQSQYILLALWTALNGVFFQFADPWVDGDLQQLLVNTTPIWTMVLSFVLLPLCGIPFHPVAREWWGTAVVGAGVVIGLIPTFEDFANGTNQDTNDSNEDKWYWVLSFLLSVMWQSLQAVQQEIALRPPYRVKEATCLFWYNMYSVLPYILLIPTESVKTLNGTPEGHGQQYAWENQKYAFMCYFGQAPQSEYDNGNCTSPAWIWPTLFVFAYIGMFFFQALVIQRTNAFYAIIIGVMAPPLSAVVFNFPQIVYESNQENFTIYDGMSFLICFIGVVLKGAPQAEPEIDRADSDGDSVLVKSPDHARTGSPVDDISDGGEPDDR